MYLTFFLIFLLVFKTRFLKFRILFLSKNFAGSRHDLLKTKCPSENNKFRSAKHLFTRDTWRLSIYDAANVSNRTKTWQMKQQLGRRDKENLIACDQLQLPSSYFEINTDITVNYNDDCWMIYLLFTRCSFIFSMRFSYISQLTSRRRRFRHVYKHEWRTKESLAVRYECVCIVDALGNIVGYFLFFRFLCELLGKWSEFLGNALKFIRSASGSGCRRGESMEM